MSAFVDTSGLYASFLGSEDGHADVVRASRRGLTTGRLLWTMSCMLVETIALFPNCVDWIRCMISTDEHALSVLSVRWVSEALRRRSTRI